MKTTRTLISLSLLAVLTACNDGKDTSTAEAPAPAKPVPEAMAQVDPAASSIPTESAGASDKPFVVLTETEEITAIVAAINHETREVTLQLESGEISFVAGDEVQNLEQVQVGDEVVAAYLSQLTMELIDGEGLEAGEGLIEIAERAEKGELPGMMSEQTEVRVFMVEAIDLEDNTFKLRNADGEVREFTASHRENLKLADVGDALVVTTTEMVAVGVVRAE
ncbi:hypothetical protein [Gilvimarinus algae]|uniref:DUF5666 domain-containing protein n=1 Tax=Gilvimarinus algae TaxID=3058037 RepID=A0ABT8THU8_9GAMM|nr:hypothetical protein [Gilvimarinus sp. SDUM040014]MDO3383669.1 hypothetical protein [Gilvimarinus sp. SDUM040014]